MSLPIVTDKTLPCTTCGARIKITESSRLNENDVSVYLLKCKKCGGTCEYHVDFVGDVLSGKLKI